jgi:predicted TIM-barrel fold metal-dependent hydrolase
MESKTNKIIDVHTHLAYHKIFPKRFLYETTKGLMASLGFDESLREMFFQKFLSDAEGDLHVQKMDDAGIQSSIMLIADFGYELGEAAMSIEEMHEHHKFVMEKHEGRFMVFSGVDPRRGEKGVKLFKKAIENYGFHGMKLYPPCGYELNDELLTPFYEICDYHELPIQPHTGPSLEILRTERNYPESLHDVLSKYKKLKFILGHAGAVNVDVNIELAKRYDNVFLDISTFNSVEGDYFKSRLRKMFDVIPNKVMFGSDFPIFSLVTSQSSLIDHIRNLQILNANELEALYYNNFINYIKN